MRVPGFEPGTSALSELRSSQLSYTRDVQPNPSSFARVPTAQQKSQPIRLALRDAAVRRAICRGERSGEWSWVFLLGSRVVYWIIRGQPNSVNPDYAAWDCC